MFQTTAFHSYAYQVAGTAANDNTGNGKRETWQTPYQKLQITEYNEKIKRQKTELQKLDSVLGEYRRKQRLAAQNKLIADYQSKLRIEKLEQGFLEEINRLMQVRALLLQQIRQNEEALILLLMLKRRRLRVA